MENILLYFSLSLLSILVVRFLLRSSSRRNLPPSPFFRLPIIGHLHLLGRPAQHAFKKLADKYGPVYSLRFGSRLVVIITSPEAVKECFTKNDVVLAARPLLNSGKYMAYDNTIFAAASYGEHWRNLRRIGSIEIYSPTRLNKFLDSRSDEVKRLLRQLGKNNPAAAAGFSKVKLEPLFAELTFNIVMRMVAGKSYFGENVSNEEEAKQFRYIMKEIFMISEASSPGDFIPIWNWIDPTGYEKKLKNIAKKVDVFLVDLIEEIRNRKGEGNTMVDHLLSMQISEPQFFSDQIIKGLIWVIMLAGTDTQSGTLTWTMSHLLNNPEVLKKAKAEIDSVVGRERLVEENDLSKLTYLQQVISETLRLNPLPLLLPHCASEDCTIQGYHIPRDTMLLFNVWAIHRDPKLWDDALTFKPERHATLTIEDQYKYLPFGLGRRACPGGGMANRVVGLALASMIQCFEWKRVSDELVDMTVGNGITASRAFPLEVMCKPWPSMERVLVEEVGLVRK